VTKKARAVKRLWRDYNLSVVLDLLFIASWVGQLITQWFIWTNEQQDHHQSLQVGAFLWQFWESTLENWQSEFLQLFSFVVLASLFIHKGSAESKDSDEQMQKSLDRIEKRLKAMEGGEKTGAKNSWRRTGHSTTREARSTMPTGVAAVLTALVTMAVVSGVLVAVVVLLNRVPHDTQ
jgi:hypothetical protein